MISNILLNSCFLLGAVAGSDGEVSKHDFETAARNYRITVYNNFHKNRAEYDHLMDLGKRAEQSWRTANESQRFETLDWFRVSATSAVSGQGTSVSQLPYWPTQSTEPNRAIVSKERTNTKKQQAQPTSFQADDHEVDVPQHFAERNYDAQKEQSKLTSVLQSVGNAIGSAVTGSSNDSEEEFEVNVRGPESVDQVGGSDLPVREQATELPASAPEIVEAEFSNEEAASVSEFDSEPNTPTLAANPITELLELVKATPANESEMTTAVERVEEMYWQRALAGDDSTESDAQFAEVLTAVRGRLTEISDDFAGGLLERVDALNAE